MAAIEGKMSWLITGASGQLGKSLIEHLEERGAFYTGLTKGDLDISSPVSKEKIIDLKPSVIVNCAAYTLVDQAETERDLAAKVNVIGAKHVALAAKELGVPLIHISTDYVFSGQRNTPWKTSDKTKPVSQYGRTKLEGERCIQDVYPEHSLILRTAWLYGPFGKNFAKTILKKVLSTKDEIRVVDDQIGQPTSTLDLARQIYNAGTDGIPAGIYHATNSGQVTWYRFAREILILSGEPTSRIKPIKSSEYPTPAKRPSYSVLDHSEWQNTTVPEMDNWKLALERAFPLIMRETKKEMNLG